MLQSQLDHANNRFYQSPPTLTFGQEPQTLFDPVPPLERKYGNIRVQDHLAWLKGQLRVVDNLVVSDDSTLEGIRGGLQRRVQVDIERLDGFIHQQWELKKIHSKLRNDASLDPQPPSMPSNVIVTTGSRLHCCRQ